MSAATTYKLLIALALCASRVSAISSLYIPGFDPQPVTANELGVGANGETTYLIAPGVSSGTLDDSGFYGPATLVVGPTTAALTYIDPVMGVDLYENCDITGDIAVCVDVVAMAFTDSLTTTSTETVIETVSPFAIQGGGPATTTPAPGSSGSSVPAATADSSDASYASGSSTATPSMTRSSVSSTGTAAPQTTQGASAQKANGAAKLGSFSMLSLVAAASAAIFLLSA